MRFLIPCLFLFFFFSGSIQAQVSTTIVNIQTVNINGSTDASSFDGQLVTVEGVVTASAESDNLDAIFIQQEGETEWAGIQLKNGSDLIELVIGDRVRVTGTVDEESGVTLIENVIDVQLIGTGTINPLSLSPNLFTNYSLAGTEQYESMLIELKEPNDLISVVEANADEPNNFGEWRVGADAMNPDSGCRILTGRQTSTVFSSLNVSYINDIVWATNSGNLNVSPIVVELGDEFEAIRGIMYYGFGNMKLLPRNNADLDAVVVGLSSTFVGLESARVFPNPLVDQLTLELQLSKAQNLSIRLFDVTGNQVQVLEESRSMVEGMHLLNYVIGSHLPKGMYFIQLRSAQGIRMIKIMKG